MLAKQHDNLLAWLPCIIPHKPLSIIPHKRHGMHCATSQVRKLEKHNVDGQELLERLRILEDRVEVLNKTRMPDFEPEDVYRRLDKLRATTEQLHESITVHKLQQEQVGSGESCSRYHGRLLQPDMSIQQHGMHHVADWKSF
jgi:hypothetical protein